MYTTKIQHFLKGQYSQLKSKVTVIFPYKFRIYEETQKTTLGRWQTHDCKDKIFSKVDYNNTDHCGSCGSVHPITTKTRK
jgi:hypothetical protein